MIQIERLSRIPQITKFRCAPIPVLEPITRIPRPIPDDLGWIKELGKIVSYRPTKSKPGITCEVGLDLDLLLDEIKWIPHYVDPIFHIPECNPVIPIARPIPRTIIVDWCLINRLLGFTQLQDAPIPNPPRPKIILNTPLPPEPELPKPILRAMCVTCGLVKPSQGNTVCSKCRIKTTVTKSR